MWVVWPLACAAARHPGSVTPGVPRRIESGRREKWRMWKGNFWVGCASSVGTHPTRPATRCRRLHAHPPFPPNPPQWPDLDLESCESGSEQKKLETCAGNVAQFLALNGPPSADKGRGRAKGAHADARLSGVDTVEVPLRRTTVPVDWGAAEKARGQEGKKERGEESASTRPRRRAGGLSIAADAGWHPGSVRLSGGVMGGQRTMVKEEGESEETAEKVVVDVEANKKFLYETFPKFEVLYREQRELLRKLNILEADIGKQMTSITSTSKEMGTTLKAAMAAEAKESETAREYKTHARELERIDVVLRQVKLEQPKPAGTAVKTVLGGINVNLRTMGKRFDYKDEYEHFKLRYTIFIMAGAAVLLMFPRYPMLYSAYQFLLMGYYLIVALREEVLITNGSRIRLWWRAHHYLTFIQSGLLFSWPETEDNDDFRRLFVVFSLYIGMIQVAQFYYQSRSLYYKRAFPAVASTGIRTSSEAEEPARSHSAPRGDMMATTSDLPRGESLSGIVVALGVAYVFQLYNAYHLFVYEWAQSNSWQIPLLGAIFAILGVGNIRTTVVVLYRKYQEYRTKWRNHRRAIENYEKYHHLPRGSVTINQVAETREGVAGWSEKRSDKKNS
eukprot:m.12945 g.12945  ORF g.12945 m.12945 type:complete len:618 (-) comp4605_c0_seq1:254-2107(-)